VFSTSDAVVSHVPLSNGAQMGARGPWAPRHAPVFRFVARIAGAALGRCALGACVRTTTQMLRTGRLETQSVILKDEGATTQVLDSSILSCSTQAI
jgi:hypothetical protein